MSINYLSLYKLLLFSWSKTDGCLHSEDEIISWLNSLSNNTTVSVKKTALSNCEPWYYNKTSGMIETPTENFFKISGARTESRKGVAAIFKEQPIIIQDEIGFLGFICKEINGILHFLVQAKIEPGNINSVQISPTVQATKSNFTQVHGGKKTMYFDYFINAKKNMVIVDQLQSEQSSRFYKKRNRNIIILTAHDIECSPTHMWVTIGQIKRLMKYPNLVNMDTRTVLSCIPFADCIRALKQDTDTSGLFTNKYLLSSLIDDTEVETIPKIYNFINDWKMFDVFKTELIPLHALQSWNMSEVEISCIEKAPFKVVFCDINIEGREVTHWKQPLFQATEKAVYGLFCTVSESMMKFLVKARAEIGCFDQMELSPTVQLEPNSENSELDPIEKLFLSMYEKKQSIKYDTILSEEGGRFYHDQNYNVIIETEESQIGKLPPGYFWASYGTLAQLLRVNNCLNVQLRNLLALLEI